MTRNTTQSYCSSHTNRKRSCAQTDTQYWRYRKVRIRTTKCTFFFLSFLYCRHEHLNSFFQHQSWLRVSGTFFSDCNCLHRRIHPNVIFLYDALACGVNSPEQSGCICSYVCVRCGPLAPTLVLTNAHPALYFCILCERALPELEQSNNNQDEKDKKKERKKKSVDKHWLHSEQGRDCFTFSSNFSESAREVTKFLSSAARDPVQTESETTPPNP